MYQKSLSTLFAVFLLAIALVFSVESLCFAQSAFDLKYDMRDPNRDGDVSDSLLTPVKDQGDCDASWAFAVYGALESYVKSNFGLSHDYSEDHLKNNHGFDAGPCEGGTIEMATAYLARHDGPLEEGCLDCTPLRYVDNVVFMPGRTGTTEADIDYVQELLVNHGALITSMHWDESRYDDTTSTYYAGDELSNHNVVIVGWDDDIDVPMVPFQGAFIVRDSRGVSFGDNGYFYVSYQDMRLAFEKLAYFVDEDDSQLEFDTIYQYDPLGRTFEIGQDDADGDDWGANIFTPTENGQLTAVGFYANAPNTSYEIHIYNTFDSASSSFSEELSTQNGVVDHEGYYTVKLDTPVSLYQNDSFGVVIRFITPDYPDPIPIEKPVDGASAATANAGESYVSFDGTTFHDTINSFLGLSNTNVCIKALVKTGINEVAEITSPPPESTLASTSVLFEWTTDAGADSYQLEIRNSEDGTVIYDSGQITSTSVTASGLPDSGEALDVTLKSNFAGESLQNDYTYTAYTFVGEKAEMISPVSGSTLSSTSVTFTWDSKDAESCRLDVGAASGGSDIHAGESTTATSDTVSGLPDDGSTVYVRLWSLVNEESVYNDYTYTACSECTGGEVRMTYPATDGATLSAASETFTWTGDGVDQFWIYVGTSRAGSSDIYSGDQGTGTSVEVANLPENGVDVHVRLWWLSEGIWQYRDYTYVAYTSPDSGSPAEMITPEPGAELTSAEVTFTWENSGADAYWLYIGTTEGLGDIYGEDQGTGTSVTVTDLPDNGIPLYVQLWSLVDGYWQCKEYTYTAFKAADSIGPAGMLTPAPDSALDSTEVTFTWEDTGADSYWLYIGSLREGSNDIYSGGQGTKASVIISELPDNGVTLYVRLWSLADGRWLYNDYVYTAFKAEENGGAGEIQTPAPETFLNATEVTFTWSQAGADKYWLYVGTSGVGSNNLYAQNHGTDTSATVSGLPTSVKVYVRLWSLVDGMWLYKDYVYNSSPTT